MRIDASGNVGIGVTPNSWNSIFKSVQIGSSDPAFIAARTDGPSQIHVGVNAYYDAGGSWRYINSDFASRAYQSSGVHYWETASSGTAGNAITWSEAMRIDSSGNLLVGTTAPDSNSLGIGLLSSGLAFAVRDGGAAFIAHRKSSDGDIIQLKKDNVVVGSIGIESGGFYIDGEAGHTGLRFGAAQIIPRDNGVDTDGATDLGFNGGSFRDLYLSGKAQADSYQFAQNSSATGATEAVYRPTTGEMAFKTNSSERMRIDASGNLLVGKTAADGGVNGGEIRSNGETYLTATSAQPLALNRKSTDGAIATFAKDGTTVGSIGSYNGVDLYIGDGEAGVKFSNDNNSIIPWNTNTNASRGDNTDLGGSSDRFRDLYLSGGAYLGGTAAANKLDDYEEGTWTPTIVGSTTAGAFTYNIQEGKYTKVGNSVSVNCAIYVTATATSPVGNVNIYGLPFTIGNQFPSFTIGWSQFITFADQLGAYGGGTQITLRNMLSAGSGANVSGADFGSAFYIFVSGTYQV
jgi:hypothetical protein